jgi:hypothetical protein
MTMITTAFLLATLGAAIPALVRRSASALASFGRALLAAMHASREREAARHLARYRDLIVDADAPDEIKETQVPEAGNRSAATRRDEVLAVRQAIPFQPTAREAAPRIGGGPSRSDWSGSWRGAQ